MARIFFTQLRQCAGYTGWGDCAIFFDESMLGQHQHDPCLKEKRVALRPAAPDNTEAIWLWYLLPLNEWTTKYPGRPTDADSGRRKIGNVMAYCFVDEALYQQAMNGKAIKSHKVKTIKKHKLRYADPNYQRWVDSQHSLPRM